METKNKGAVKVETETVIKNKAKKCDQMKKLILSIAAIEQEKKEANAKFKEEIDRYFEELNQLANEDERQGQLDLPVPESVQKKKRARKDLE